MNSDNSKPRGHGFIPEQIFQFLGNFPRAVAKLKKQPNFFIVEEQHTDSHRCTVSSSSDLTDVYGNQGAGELIAVTLVKERLTTPAAIDRAKALVGRRTRVSYAGLKDRWAQTSQRIVFEGADWDEVVRSCMPSAEQLREHGFFLKDPKKTTKKLGKGHLVGNNFIIRAIAPNYTKAQLENYMSLRLAALRHVGNKFANAYGGQRLGFRQQLDDVGDVFIQFGPEPGIKRFLTEISPNEKADAQDVRRRLLSEWEAAEAKGAATRTPVCKQVMHLHGMLQILETKLRGRPAYQALNMIIEHRIVQKLIQTLDYTETMKALYDDFSLWVGAVQAYWFNQLLARFLSGDLPLDMQHGDPRIPLLIDEPRTMKFYEKHCPEAIPPQMDETVRRMFLTPRRQYGRGPRRPVYVPVKGFEYKCEDGAVEMKFQLGSGCYATVFLSMLFDISDDADLSDGSES